MFLALIIKFSNQPSARRTQSHIIETYVHLKLEYNISMCVCVCPRTGYAVLLSQTSHQSALYRPT